MTPASPCPTGGGWSDFGIPIPLVIGRAARHTVSGFDTCSGPERTPGISAALTVRGREAGANAWPPRRVTGVGVHPMCRRRSVRRPPRRAHLQRGPRLSPAMVGSEPGPHRAVPSSTIVSCVSVCIWRLPVGDGATVLERPRAGLSRELQARCVRSG